jgi:hypothetical protein
MPITQTPVPLPSSTPITVTEATTVVAFNGNYTLQTKFLEADNKRLEGNPSTRRIFMKKGISTISIIGKAFVDESGNRFIVRGVALSPNRDVDLLSDDYSDYMKNYVIPQLVYLNVNMIRVYQIDESKIHKTVMDLLAQNNIYVMVGMVTPAVSVNRMKPQYTLALYNRTTTIASEFCNYNNTFAFSVGNEVVFPGEIYENTSPPEDAAKANSIIQNDAAVMKSLIRDVKIYMSACSLRMVPVGMAMQDGPSSTLTWGGIGTDIVAEFYAGGDPTERADFIGINTYRYVNSKTSGPMNSYDGLANEVANIPVPVFLTETGGFESPPYERDWAIVAQLYTEQLLSQNLSGQVAFQFFEKGAGFGLYTEMPAASANPTASGIPLVQTKLGGAINLSRQYFESSQLHLPPMPTPVPDPSTCPSACNPALIPCPVPNINIIIKNYSPSVLKALQSGSVLADLPAGTPSNPTSTKVMVSGAVNLLIQQEESPQQWISVCQVAANKLIDGLVVQTNVPWGDGVACNIS